MPNFAKKDENEKIVKQVEEDGLSYAQIGEKLGITKQAVSKRYHRHKKGYKFGIEK